MKARDLFWAFFAEYVNDDPDRRRRRDRYDCDHRSDRIEHMTMLNADSSFLLLEEGRKTEAEEVSTHPGGGAVNAAADGRHHLRRRGGLARRQPCAAPAGARLNRRRAPRPPAVFVGRSRKNRLPVSPPMP